MAPGAAYSGGNRPRNFLDAPRLRTLVYELSREHQQLRLPLLRVADRGIALAANPADTASRRQAREAWQELLRIVDLHMERHEDEELVESAESLRLVPDSVARGMLDVCARLKQLEYQVSQIDFDQSPPPMLARAGEAMRQFATAMDDLANREERDVLPRLQRLLYEHGVALKR